MQLEPLVQTLVALFTSLVHVVGGAICLLARDQLPRAKHGMHFFFQCVLIQIKLS